MPNRIFISYSKKDKDFAYRLVDDLESQDFKVWIDRAIGGGEAWRKSIDDNLRAADEVIIILSKNAIESKWVNHESSMAVGLKKKSGHC